MYNKLFLFFCFLHGVWVESLVAIFFGASHLSFRICLLPFHSGPSIHSIWFLFSLFFVAFLLIMFTQKHYWIVPSCGKNDWIQLNYVVIPFPIKFSSNWCQFFPLFYAHLVSFSDAENCFLVAKIISVFFNIKILYVFFGFILFSFYLPLLAHQFFWNFTLNFIFQIIIYTFHFYSISIASLRNECYSTRLLRFRLQFFSFWDIFYFNFLCTFLAEFFCKRFTRLFRRLSNVLRELDVFSLFFLHWILFQSTNIHTPQ